MSAVCGLVCQQRQFNGDFVMSNIRLFKKRFEAAYCCGGALRTCPCNLPDMLSMALVAWLASESPKLP
jgi:hypothetical protein